MPSRTTVIENFASVITYSPGWSAIAGDPTTQDVAMRTLSAGGTASFKFNGTGCAIYGPIGEIGGPYTVSINGTQVWQGTSQGSQQWGVNKYNGQNLPLGLHEVVLTNLNNNAQTVERIEITETIGPDSQGEVVVNNVDDSHESWSWDGQWSTTPANQSTFFGSTGHSTTTTGASATFTFTGEAVSIFGPKTSNGASYIVQLDGGTSQTFSAAYQSFLSQTLLFHASLLGQGKHTIKISHSSTSGQVFALDYAQVFTTSDAKDSNGGSSSKALGAGAIAGIVVGVVALLAIIGVLVFLLMRKRRKDSLEEGEEKSDIVRPFAQTLPFVPHPNPSQNGGYGVAGSKVQPTTILSPSAGGSSWGDGSHDEWSHSEPTIPAVMRKPGMGLPTQVTPVHDEPGPPQYSERG